MPLRRVVWAHARYKWTFAGGAWADVHRWWASAPGRGYPGSESSTSGTGLTIAYQGFGEGERFVLPYLREQQAKIDGPVTVTEKPTIGWRRLRHSLSESGADILLVGCSSRRAVALPHDRSLVLPFRFHFIREVVPDAAAMLNKVSPNERRQFTRRRRLHEWEWEVGTDIAGVEFFYERMHLPLMARRHGDATRNVDWDIARHCLFRHGRLFFVTEGGKRVAGVLARLDDAGETLYMRLLGVLDGDETHYRSGAAKAVYFLAAEWAAANGVRRIDMSGGEPFPGKGVFQFKRLLHPTAVLPPDHFRDRRVWLRVVRDRDVVRDFLVATPMLALDESGRLTAVYFFDSRRPPRTEIRATGPGVELRREIDLDEFLAGSGV